jgi:hypothetical protein
MLVNLTNIFHFLKSSQALFGPLIKYLIFFIIKINIALSTL